MTEIEELRAKIAEQQKRLDYVALQLVREAKFKPEWKSENRRFHRAFKVVLEVKDELGRLSRG